MQFMIRSNKWNIHLTTVSNTLLKTILFEERSKICNHCFALFWLLIDADLNKKILIFLKTQNRAFPKNFSFLFSLLKYYTGREYDYWKMIERTNVRFEYSFWTFKRTSVQLKKNQCGNIFVLNSLLTNKYFIQIHLKNIYFLIFLISSF